MIRAVIVWSVLIFKIFDLICHTLVIWIRRCVVGGSGDKGLIFRAAGHARAFAIFHIQRQKNALGLFDR